MKSVDLIEYLSKRENDYNPTWFIQKVADTEYLSITPNKINLKLTSGDDYTYKPESQYQSTMLWYHSLAWLKVISKQYGDFEFINNIILDYHKFMFSSSYEEIMATLTSRDHLVAEQIRSITYLLATGKVVHIKQCNEMLLNLTRWAQIEENVKNNNHGMMLVASLLHVPIFIDFEGKEDELESYAIEKLKYIISGAFDSTGLCKENSPIYHRFYITYLKRLVAEFSVLPLNNKDFPLFLEEVLEKAESALQKTTLPDGSLPPFGDGNTTPKEYPPTRERSVFYSEESGFYCVKTASEKKKYFSVKSGYSSITHKHSDDTSIFYWYDGQPIITDAGFFNYDWTDSRTVVVKSQRGHSGAFYRKFDSLYPATLYPAKTPTRVKSGLNYRVDGNMNILEARSEIDNKYSIKREIKFSHLGNFLVNDTFTSPSISDEKVVRYLINGDLDVKETEEGLRITGKGFAVRLIIKRAKSVSIERGVEEDSVPARGWVVDKQFYSLKPCWSIELIPETNNILTNIVLEEKTQ
ncbi:MAG: heparinase II/III family protein [Rothia sp. (in: high G+C Gram-positive bacteria)]|uniref:heparinase II/III domain-containing protein n=1 Tax=Rothia sp. (in: high G+C Gram-positive bacteria) TaxID=1885016 RepID=UPI0026F817AC|nr:heparinase II/III family protein [Rothia sp. (in: high G+C Gram-positive bacteria)]